MRFTTTAYHGTKAVDGAGCVQEEVCAAVVLVGVVAHDGDLEVVLGGDQGEDLLGAVADDSLGGLIGEKYARGLTDTVGAEGAPPNLLGVATANGVVLVLAGHAVGGDQPGVDDVKLGVVILHHDTRDMVVDTPEGWTWRRCWRWP